MEICLRKLFYKKINLQANYGKNSKLNNYHIV